MTIGAQLAEVPMLHLGASTPGRARARPRPMLADVHLPDPDDVLERYPHQLSGGQQQRVVIAMALLGQPKLLLLDEPTTGLDVTVEAAVIDLVDELRRRYGTSLLFISHNLGVIAEICDRVGIMYSGELVEEAATARLFATRAIPIRGGLIDCIPDLATTKRAARLPPFPATFLCRANVRAAACLRRAAPASSPAAATSRGCRCLRRGPATRCAACVGTSSRAARCRRSRPLGRRPSWHRCSKSPTSPSAIRSATGAR